MSAGAPVAIMAAPNGARRGKADHPALPVTIAETAAEAAACRAAGAAALHAHVRDAEGRHVLDAGLYRELAAAVAEAAPDMLLQVTTEAAGRYGPEAQAAMVRELHPRFVSVALREMVPDAASEAHAASFYAFASEAGIGVQHILYDAADARRLAALTAAGVVPEAMSARLLVLGRFTAEGGRPEDLAAFPDAGRAAWCACAFGVREAACLEAAMRSGGHARTGFENNLALPDGGRAPSTAALVGVVAASAARLGRPLMTPAEAAPVLGAGA